jgi:hypothetical protein
MDSKELRWKYRLFGIVLMWLAASIAGFPLWLWCEWLAGQFGLRAFEPLLWHKNGFLFFGVLMLGFLVLFSFSGILVLGVAAATFRWRSGWTANEAWGFVFRGEVPESWLKRSQTAGK